MVRRRSLLLSLLSMEGHSFLSSKRIHRLHHHHRPQVQTTQIHHQTNNNNNNVNNEAEPTKKPRKAYTSTVCIVPPEHAIHAWNQLTNVRTQLQDPGLYRWPPHVNLLYPFAEFNNNKNKKKDSQDGDLRIFHQDGFDEEELSILEKLREATKIIPPFHLTLQSFGCFGGKRRGVLWLQPDSSTFYYTHESPSPLVQLQKNLQEAIPYCHEQQRNGVYQPHMTLSHLETLAAAEEAQSKLEMDWTAVRFPVNEIYVLQRVGDGGQFQIAATIPLGPEEKNVQVFTPPRRFAHMPLVEEAWVREERMKLKQRRNRRGRKGGRRRRGGGDGGGRGESKSKDTPEEIAAKRAARKAKREAQMKDE